MHIEEPSQTASVELDLWPDTGLRVNAERLRILISASAFTPTSFAAAVGCSRKTIYSWLAGTHPDNFIERIARTVKVSPPTLALPVLSPATVGPFFRTSSHKLGLEKARGSAGARALLVAELANFLDRKVGLSLPVLPTARRTMRSNPEFVAQAARTRFQPKNGPIVNVIRTAEQAGVIVCYATPEMTSVEAHSVEVAGWPIVMLKPTVDYYRQRWSTAHELGHLLLHRDALEVDEAMEHEANQFAAEFLLPRDQITGILPSTFRDFDIAMYRRLKESWGVSISTLVRRARETEQMSEAEFIDAKARIVAKGWSRREPGQMETVEVINTLPDALEKHLARGFSRELTLRESGIPADLLDSFLLRVPPERPRPVRVEL